MAEERAFLKEYTIPFVQLDPLKTILVFSHEHNSFDKRTLLENLNPQTTRVSNKKVDMFIKFPHEANIKKFFLEDIDGLLLNYLPGDPKLKTDVVKQTKELKEQREQQMREQSQQQSQQIMMQQPGCEPVAIGINDAVNIINQQQEQMKQLLQQMKELENALTIANRKTLNAEEQNAMNKNKNVTFSENIIQPSVNKKQKELENKILELENKLKTSEEKEEKLLAQVKLLLTKKTSDDFIGAVADVKSSVSFTARPGQGSFATQQLTQKGASHPDEFGPVVFKSVSKSDPEFRISIIS